MRPALGANYPNPFNPETVIPFALPASSRVLLAVYDVLGRRVALLADGELAAGRHRVRWRAEGSPAGLYVVRLRAGSVEQVVRVTLVK